MIKVNILSFRDGKKQRCSLCDCSKTVSKLALFHEDSIVCGDLILCAECADVLEDALLHGATVEEIYVATP